MNPYTGQVPTSQVEPPVDLDALMQEESLQTRVEREIAEGRLTLPVMPHVAIEVRRLIDADAPGAALVAALEKEPAIATALVKYANSVAYAGLREVKDLSQAVLRLGRNAVEQTVLGLSVRAMFKGPPEYTELYRTIWKHSVTTALAARRLAPRVHVPPETAFLAGLLHDIGKIVILQSITTLKRREGARLTLDECTVHEFMDALHCTIGMRLFEAWHIPAELCEVVRRHHDAALSPPADTLIAVVQVANMMAHKLGASLHPDPELSLIGTPASSMLRLDDIKIANVLVDVEDDMASTEGLF